MNYFLSSISTTALLIVFKKSNEPLKGYLSKSHLPFIYQEKLPEKDLFQKMLSGNLFPWKSSSHLLPRCSPDNSIHDLKNNFLEEHFKEYFRYCLKYIGGMQQAVIHHWKFLRHLLYCYHKMQYYSHILLKKFDFQLSTFWQRFFSEGIFCCRLFSGGLFPGAIFPGSISATILLIPKFENEAVLNSKE